MKPLALLLFLFAFPPALSHAAIVAIQDLGALATPASGDLLFVSDVSDTTEDASGTGKKITFANLFQNYTPTTGLDTFAELDAIVADVDLANLDDGGTFLAAVTFDLGLLTDTIGEETSAAGVTVDSVLLKDGGIVCADAATLEVDAINEATADAGVTVEAVALEDGGIICADGAALEVDTINEATADAGVTVESVALEDGGIICADGAALEVDTINEATAAAGVTIDGVLVQDGGLTLAATLDLGSEDISNVDSITVDIISVPDSAVTLAAAATAIPLTSNFATVTGDAGSNTVATVTGGRVGMVAVLLFVDGLVTITDTDAHTADTVDLSAAFTSADDTTLTLLHDGTSWYELSRSTN